MHPSPHTLNDINEIVDLGIKLLESLRNRIYDYIKKTIKKLVPIFVDRWHNFAHLAC